MIIKGCFPFRKPIRRILIIQLGDIGDVVWATPTFQAVRNAYPHARITVLVREHSGTLIENDPSIDCVLEVKHYRGSVFQKIRQQLQFLRQLRQQNFDLAIDLRADDRGAIMAFLCGASYRMAVYYRDGVPYWRNPLFTHLVDPDPPIEPVYGAANQSLRVVREFGMPAATLTPRLWISEQSKKNMHALMTTEGFAGEKRWITINPFSRWRYKEWGYEKWTGIIDWLWHTQKIATVIVGSGAEHEKASLIARQCSGKVFNAAGQTSLGDLAVLLSFSSWHMGVDSAAPHIAAAVGTPTLTIYGPSNWKDWAPQGAGHHVVLPSDECVPCRNKGCNGEGYSRCLTNLGVEDVKQAIQAFLSKISNLR